jgi:16S rRNA processing protein RimM
MSPLKDLICLGEIVGAHGIKGAVKIKTFTEHPEDLLAYGPLILHDHTSIKIRIENVKSGHSLLVMVEGCTTRNQSESLIGTKLYIHRNQLPALREDEFYQEDLVGAEVFDDASQKIGIVTAIQNFGAGDFLEIHPAQGSKPITAIFSDDSIVSVDLAARKIVIRAGFLLV